MGNRIEIIGLSGQVYISEEGTVETGGDKLLGPKEEVEPKEKKDDVKED